MKNNAVRSMTISALLIAIGVLIPMFSPLSIRLEPASFTLASHVSIFVAMMISPPVAAAVAIGTTAGFFIGGFPIVIVLRAATHLIFALCGAAYLQRHPITLTSPGKTRLFSLAVGVLHAACEVAVVSWFYFSGAMGTSYYQKGFVDSVLLLVGVGSVIHSMVDFEIALAVHKALSKQRSLAST